MNSLYVLRTSTRTLAFARTAARSAGRSPRAFVWPLPVVVFRVFPAEVLPAAGRSGIEVRGEPGPAALPPEPGLLVPAERAGRVEPVVGVGPDHAGAQLPGHPQNPAALLGPDPRRQPVGGVVRLRHRLRSEERRVGKEASAGGVADE